MSPLHSRRWLPSLCLQVLYACECNLHVCLKFMLTDAQSFCVLSRFSGLELPLLLTQVVRGAWTHVLLQSVFRVKIQLFCTCVRLMPLPVRAETNRRLTMTRDSETSSYRKKGAFYVTGIGVREIYLRVARVLKCLTTAPAQLQMT
jgi:hypothetical protein